MAATTADISEPTSIVPVRLDGDLHHDRQRDARFAHHRASPH